MITSFSSRLISNSLIVMAYIDPGTGSMLFTILIGAISVILYGLRGFYIKLKYSFNKSSVKDTRTIPIVIYSDDKRYWNTFESICDEFEKRKQKLVYMSQSQDDPAFDKEYEYVETTYIGKGNAAFTKLNMLNADLVLSSTPSLDVYQWRRSKDVKYYIHIVHAANDITYYRMFGIDYYDAIILSGGFQADQVRKLEQFRKLKEKELVVLGLPYLDALKKRLDNSSQKHKEITILLAPSWGESGLLYKYGSRILDALIETNYHIIVRPHPQSFISEKEMIEELMKKYPDNNQIEWNKDNYNFDSLSRSDLLISDFSGVIFDFALVFNKPFLYADFSIDNSVYDAWWLDEQTWNEKTLPILGKKINDKDIENLKELIDKTMNDKNFMKNLNEIKKECWANVGCSAPLITDYLLAKHSKITENNV